MDATHIRVRLAALGRGRGQDWLARQLGMHPSLLSRYLREIRQPPADLADRIDAILARHEQAERAAEAARAAALVDQRRAEPRSAADTTAAADLLEWVRARLAEIERAKAAGDAHAAHAAEVRMRRVVMEVKDGRIAHPAALCLALGIPDRTYADVVSYYAGRPEFQARATGPAATLLRALRLAGDERFIAPSVPDAPYPERAA